MILKISLRSRYLLIYLLPVVRGGQKILRGFCSNNNNKSNNPFLPNYEVYKVITFSFSIKNYREFCLNRPSPPSSLPCALCTPLTTIDELTNGSRKKRKKLSLGGGKALVAGTLNKYFFLLLP